MLHTAVWEVWAGASLCVKLHFAMDAHAIHISTLNQLLTTLLAIVLELARRFRVELVHHPVPTFGSPSARRSSSSAGSFEFLHPDPEAAEAPEAPLLTPPRCEYHCRWCTEPCSRLPGRHKHHSCWEHRHRR